MEELNTELTSLSSTDQDHDSEYMELTQALH